jgi:hypothetical protein
MLPPLFFAAPGATHHKSLVTNDIHIRRPPAARSAGSRPNVTVKKAVDLDNTAVL